MANEKVVQREEVHLEAEQSVWPFVVAMSILLIMFGFMSAFHWKVPAAGMVLSGLGVVGTIVGLFGWVSEVSAAQTESGLSKLAIIFFIFSEVALFGGLFSGYLYNMLPAAVWPPANTPSGVPPLNVALILSVFLLSSSATIHLAESSLERDDAAGFRRWLFATMLLGALFLGGQAIEWSKLLAEGFTVSTNAYGTFFYTITGFHGSHVLVGLILQIFIMLLAFRNRISKHRSTLMKTCGYYWHFVDGVWLLVLSIIYVLPHF
jgi:cytochrome c oxidase subunit 3